MSTELAARLRALRGRRKVSLTEVCRRSGVGYSHASRIEAGVVQPRDETLQRLADALEVPFSDLSPSGFTDSGTPPEEGARHER